MARIPPVTLAQITGIHVERGGQQSGIYHGSPRKAQGHLCAPPSMIAGRAALRRHGPGGNFPLAAAFLLQDARLAAPALT